MNLTLTWLLACGGRLAVGPADGGNDLIAADGALAVDGLASTGTTGNAACNENTCPNGCCDGETCVVDTSEARCGFGGNACDKCRPNEICKGVCFHAQADCGPSSCEGCCMGDRMCARGDTGAFCGHGGQQCSRCVPREGTGQCVSTAGEVGGTCTDWQCGFETCAGCCANGVCMSGLTAGACGVHGTACAVCGPGTYCDEDVCRPGTACTPQNCPGCCSFDEHGAVCLAGASDQNCGNGGVTCLDCQYFDNQVCVDGACH